MKLHHPVSFFMLAVSACAFGPSSPNIDRNKRTRIRSNVALNSKGTKGTKTFPHRDLEEIRFNKFPPIDEDEEGSDIEDIKRFYPKNVHKELFPLMSADYQPLKKATLDILPSETFADSVFVDGDVQFSGPFYSPVRLNGGFADYANPDTWKCDPCTKAVVDPIYPGNPLYWDQLEEVVDAQFERRGIKGKKDCNSVYQFVNVWTNRTLNPFNPWEKKKPASERFGGFEPFELEDAATAVDGEFSNYHQLTFAAWVLDQNSKETFGQFLEFNDLGQPFRCVNDFMGERIRMGRLNTWSLDIVGPVNFMLKWNYGMPRPEEMAFLISEGKLTSDCDGVPEDLVHKIKKLNLKKATDFTAYGGGSPCHPSFPAMHSAGSTLSIWLPALYKLTAKQYLEALRMDYSVSIARTVAGVHYPQDNIAGLHVGQRIIREQLPAYMEDNYGYDREKVKTTLIV
jgi:hypothetical protein